MTIEVEYRYPVSPRTLYDKLVDREFLRAKYEAIGSRRLDFRECGPDGALYRIEWTREVRSNPPGFAKKFLAEWNRLEEIMEWTVLANGSLQGDYLGKVAGFPGELKGAFDVVAADTGCAERIRMQARVNIPLVGKKIGSFVEDDARRNLAQEHAYTQKVLG